MAVRVLIANDEPNTVTSLRYLMERAGCRVAVARTAEQAVAEFDAFAPDIVLLDLLLPGAPGPALVRHLRSHALHRGAAVILLAVKGREGEAARALAAGADACILKPFAFEEVLTTVSRCLSADAA